MYQELYEQAIAYEAGITERLVFYMTHFAEYTEKSSLKLCQEWVRNAVDPDISHEGKTKLCADIAAIRGLLDDAVQKGELKNDTPVKLLTETFTDVLYGQISAAAILDCYNSCMLQPVPTFGAEHNYFTSEKAKHGLGKDDVCIPGEVILADGTDATELIHEAEKFLNDSAFA